MNDEQLARAMIDPSAVFDAPVDVVSESALSQADKVKILRRWEYDARELQVAEEEGLAGSTNNAILDDVLAALHSLGVEVDIEHSPPTKQGGE